LVEVFFEAIFAIVILSKIVHMHFEHKTIKALIESAKTSNQRLDLLEKKLRNKDL